VGSVADGKMQVGDHLQWGLPKQRLIRSEEKRVNLSGSGKNSRTSIHPRMREGKGEG